MLRAAFLLFLFCSFSKAQLAFENFGQLSNQCNAVNRAFPLGASDSTSYLVPVPNACNICPQGNSRVGVRYEIGRDSVRVCYHAPNPEVSMSDPFSAPFASLCDTPEERCVEYQEGECGPLVCDIGSTASGASFSRLVRIPQEGVLVEVSGSSPRQQPLTGMIPFDDNGLPQLKAYCEQGDKDVLGLLWRAQPLSLVRDCSVPFWLQSGVLQWGTLAQQKNSTACDVQELDNRFILPVCYSGINSRQVKEFLVTSQGTAKSMSLGGILEGASNSGAVRGRK